MFSIGFLTLDIIIVLVIAIALFFLSISKGEHILVRFLLSFYPTTLIFSNFPFITLDGSLEKVVTYIVILIVFYFLLSKSINSKRTYGKHKKIFSGIILSIASITTILTIYYQIIPIGTLYKFTLPVETFFISTVPYGVWLVVPLIALLLTNKSRYS